MHKRRQIGFDTHTEKPSVNPQIRNSQAQAITDTVNAALPSMVFGVLADHR